MPLRNNHQSWGLVSILLHWSVAIAVFALFALGLWMTELTYYDPWYRQAPALHKSIGIILAMVVAIRIIWRFIDKRPDSLPTHSSLEVKAAHAVHALLYVLLISIFVSGYLISTADGRPIEVFQWFSIPAILQGIPNQEDIAGAIHLTLAVSLISLVVVHALGALKHHFIDRDETLSRMIGTSNTK